MVHSVEGFGVVYKAGIQILINLDVFLGQEAKTENTLSDAGSRTKAKLSRSYFFINFVANSVLNNFQKDFERVRHHADCSVV